MSFGHSEIWETASHMSTGRDCGVLDFLASCVFFYILRRSDMLAPTAMERERGHDIQQNDT
jgi:hypothetical protein